MVGKPLIEDVGLSTYNVKVFGKSQNPQGCKITLHRSLQGESRLPAATLLVNSKISKSAQKI